MILTLWKSIRIRLQRTVVSILFVLLTSISSVGLAGDDWSPGATNDTWQRISRLQSVHAAARVRSPFVTQCCSSSDPVERMAAISWIARTQSSTHIPDLELRLSDDILLVRLLAYEALKSFRHADAIALVIRYSDKIPTDTTALNRIMFYAFSGSGMRGASCFPYPRAIEDGSTKAKQQWLSHSFDYTEWVNDQAVQLTESAASHPNINLPTSVIDRNDWIRVSADADINVHISAMREPPAFEVDRSMQSPVWENLQQAKSESNIRYFNPQEALVLPGIHTVQLLQHLPQGMHGMGMGGHVIDQVTSSNQFPFFIRINRSKADELEVEKLVQDVTSLETIERLGQLRSSEAVPQLIERYRGATDCERVKIGEALAKIGDGRAAEIIFEKPAPHCREFEVASIDGNPPVNIKEWIRALDDEAQFACINQVSEAMNLSSNATRDEQYETARKLNVALSCLHRPLIPAYAQLIEKLFQDRIGQIAKQEPGKEKQFQEQMLAEAMVAASNDDPKMTAELLKRIEDLELPELYFRVIELLAPKLSSTSEYRQAIYEHFSKWRGVDRLPEPLAGYANTILKRMAYEFMERPSFITKPVWSSKEFGREYVFDDSQQFWSIENGKPELWGTFCRNLPQLRLLDADTLCVVTESAAIQVVSPGRKIRSLTASQLFADLDSAEIRRGAIRVASVGKNVVVSSQSTFVFVVPIFEEIAPWRVPDPQIIQSYPADAFDKDNPFGVDPEAVRKPIRRGKETPKSGVPNVWKQGARILIENRGEIEFAIQCVDVNDRKVLWEKQRTEIDIRKMVQDEGWQPANR